MNNQKILMLFIEPTPYITVLIKELRAINTFSIDILFLKKNHSQQWPLDPGDEYVSTSLLNSVYHLFVELKNKKYQLIHVAGWNNPLIRMVMLIAKCFAIPVTVESDTIYNVKTACWKQLIKRLLYPILFKLPALFFPGGRRQAKYLEFYGVAKKTVKIAHMTVDVAAMQSYAASYSSVAKQALRVPLYAADDIIFLYVGRLEPYKGIREIISAFKQLTCDHVKLCIVGDGSLRQEIQAETALNDRIIYAGAKYGLDLYYYYLIADAVILYSPIDQWGLVINEAMAFGKPVVVSDQVGCIDDLVLLNKTGIIVPWGYVDFLSQAMTYLIEQPQIRAMMAETAAVHIASWTVQRTAKIMNTEWENLL